MKETNIKVIFTLGDENKIIECSIEDKMGDICQKFAERVNKNINTLLFLYKENEFDINLSVKEQINNICGYDKEMNILVLEKRNNKFKNSKLKEKIDNILLLNNKIKNIINENKLHIIKYIKKKSINSPLYIQLKNIIEIFLKINEYIEIINNETKNLINFADEKIEKTDIKLNNINNKMNVNKENLLKNIKAKLNINQIFSCLDEKIKLKVIKYNNNLKNKINLKLINYIFFSDSYIIYESREKGKEYNGNDDCLKF